MTMSTHWRSTTPAGMIRWLLNLATRMLACSLNMPEPLCKHRRLRVRACAGGRDQRRQDAVPGPAAASTPVSAAVLAPAIGALPLNRPLNQGELHDPTILFCAAPFWLTPSSAAHRPCCSPLAPASLRLAQPARSAAARDRAVSDRLRRPRRLARHPASHAEGAGGNRDCGNAVWTIASIALLFSGAVTPNLLGEVFVAAQAIVVGRLGRTAIYRPAQERRRARGVTPGRGSAKHPKPSFRGDAKHRTRNLGIPGVQLRIVESGT